MRPRAAPANAIPGQRQRRQWWRELGGACLRVGAMAVDALDRKAKQLSMPTASAEDLELALIATKLSATRTRVQRARCMHRRRRLLQSSAGLAASSSIGAASRCSLRRSSN